MAGGGACASAFRAVILLDTNVVSAVMLQRPEPAVVDWLDQVDPRQVWLPSVVVFELRYGAALHPDATRRRALELNLNRLIQAVTAAGAVGGHRMRGDGPGRVSQG